MVRKANFIWTCSTWSRALIANSLHFSAQIEFRFVEKKKKISEWKKTFLSHKIFRSTSKFNFLDFGTPFKIGRSRFALKKLNFTFFTNSNNFFKVFFVLFRLEKLDEIFFLQISSLIGRRRWFQTFILSRLLFTESILTPMIWKFFYLRIDLIGSTRTKRIQKIVRKNSPFRRSVVSRSLRSRIRWIIEVYRRFTFWVFEGKRDNDSDLW